MDNESRQMVGRPQEFVGWVEHIYPSGQYGQEICVKDYEDEESKPRFPVCLRFSAGTMCMSQLIGINPGDKVRVTFYLTGKSGNGKNGYYCINKLNIAKDHGIVVLERAINEEIEEAQDEVTENGAPQEEELPF